MSLNIDADTMPGPDAWARSIRSAAARLRTLIFSDDKYNAVRIGHTIIAGLVHLVWAVIYGYTASVGEMSLPAALVLIATNMVGLLGFYPWLRSGATAKLQDTALVMPQTIWAQMSSVMGFMLAEPLRPAILQTMCWTQMFSFFSQQPRQLAISGGSAIAMLVALIVAGLVGKVPQMRHVDDMLPVLLTIAVLAILTAVTMDHGRRRIVLRLQQAQLQEAVAALSALVMTDPLTGLCNRRKMQELLVDEHARSLLCGTSFAVALIDLDHFKRVNDTQGHAIGDEVLRRVAELGKEAFRNTDVIARWGGEEFLLLMPGKDPVSAALSERAVQRLRDAILAEAPQSVLGRLGLTFSAGVAVCQLQEPLEHVLRRADDALYAAKAAGRNCTFAAVEFHAISTVA